MKTLVAKVGVANLVSVLIESSHHIHHETGIRCQMCLPPYISCISLFLSKDYMKDSHTKLVIMILCCLLMLNVCGIDHKITFACVWRDMAGIFESAPRRNMISGTCHNKKCDWKKQIVDFNSILCLLQQFEHFGIGGTYVWNCSLVM